VREAIAALRLSASTLLVGLAGAGGAVGGSGCEIFNRFGPAAGSVGRGRVRTPRMWQGGARALERDTRARVRVRTTSVCVRRRRVVVRNTCGGVWNTRRGARTTPRGVRNTRRGVRTTRRGVRNTRGGVRNTRGGVRNTRDGARKLPAGVRTRRVVTGRSMAGGGFLWRGAAPTVYAEESR
jgi:hypothetical protein